MSQLLSLLQDFLAWSKFQEDKVAQNRYLLQKLNDLGESRFFPSLHKKALKALPQQGLSREDYHYESMLLEEIQEVFRNQNPGRDPEALMPGAIHHLGHSFMIRMLRYKIRLLNRAAAYSARLEYRLLDMVLEYIEKELPQLPELIQTYYHFIQALSDPDQPAYFQSADKLLAQIVNRLSETEKDELYTSLLNLAMNWVNRGEEAYLAEVFRIYREMLIQQVIGQGGRISQHHFKNIVNVASRLQEAAWVEDFVDQWEHRMVGDSTQHAQAYSQGIRLFYQGDYQSAKPFFLEISYDSEDLFYGLDARGYLLIIYYEIGDSLGLESLCHSFRVFLDRKNKIHPDRRTLYGNFIKYLQRLSKIPLMHKDEFRELRREIEETEKRGMGSSWLLQKIAEALNEKNLSSTS